MSVVGDYAGGLYRRVFGDKFEGHSEPCDLCGATECEVVGRYDRFLRPLTNVACLRCGLIRRHPMPTDDELRRFYEREYRLQQKGSAEPKPRDIERSLQHAKALLKRIRRYLRPGAKILDLGSGQGSLAYLATQAGYDVRAIEPNVAYATWSRRKYAIDVTVGTWDTAEFPAGSFDFVVCSHVMEHLRSPSSALARIHQWLKPGGFMWFAVPDLKDVKMSPLNRYLPWHLYGFSNETVAMLALKCGFALVKGVQTNCVLERRPAPVDDYLRFPDHGREMVRFLREHTLTRHLTRPIAYMRAVSHARRWVAAIGVNSRADERRASSSAPACRARNGASPAASEEDRPGGS